MEADKKDKINLLHIELEASLVFKSIISDRLGKVVHALNPSTREAQAGGSKFEVSLAYIVSSKTAGAM